MNNTKSRKYAVTFTTTERLQLSLDVTVIEGATIEETIDQILKNGMIGDRGAGDPSGRWLVPGSQIARVDWTEPAPTEPAPTEPTTGTGLAADPNGGPGAW